MGAGVALPVAPSGTCQSRHAVARNVRTTQAPEALVLEKLASLGGQEAIERISLNEIEVHMVGFEHPLQRRSLPKHQAVLLPHVSTAGLDDRPTFRLDF